MALPSKSNIAMAMGHQAEVTQETYGNSGQGNKISLKVTANKLPRGIIKKSNFSHNAKKAII